MAKKSALPSIVRQAHDSGRTYFCGFHSQMKRPFALSSTRSGRVEGFVAAQLRFLFLTENMALAVF
ncbi:MAG: hypothetical protein WCL27_10570 [Betaproteobacteria bacterium]